MRAVPVSNNSALTAFVRDKLGPDGFMVLVDGSERLTRFQPDEYRDDCQYVYALRFNNAGPVSIQVRVQSVLHWYRAHAVARSIGTTRHAPCFACPMAADAQGQDFFLYNENNMEWPIMATERTLLSSPLYVNICPSCPTHVAPPNAVNATLLDTVPQPDIACSSTEPVYGSYVPASYLDVHWPGSFYEPLPPNQNSYRFVAAPSCAYKHAGTRYADHAPCYAAPLTSVLFTGDSHMRVAFDGIVHRLSGNQWTMTESVCRVLSLTSAEPACRKNRGTRTRASPIGTSTSDGTRSATVSSLRDATYAAAASPRRRALILCAGNRGLRHNRFRNRASPSRSPIAQKLTGPQGHHLHRFNTEEYTEHLTTVLDHITSLASTCASPSGRPRRLLYITPPAVAPREDEFVRELKDRRTNLRISHWARIGLDLAAARGWRTVDQFAPTSGFVRDTKDDAHFLETDGLDPVLDDVIAKLGICDL